jgi:SAM-dependent methyltransferase
MAAKVTELEPRVAQATTKDRAHVAGKSSPAATLPCWCGLGSWTRVFRTKRFGLVRCSSCGCYQIDPPPISGDDQSAEFYTDYYSKSAEPVTPAKISATRNAWFWRVAEKVPGLDTVRASVADIGSGDGHFCAELHAAGWPRVLGIEISKSRCARARQLYPQIPFHSCGLAETGAAPASFDLLVMDSVIEHLPNPVKLVQDLRAFLAPGGKLVMLTPNMESGHFRFLQKRWTGMLAPHAHIFLFTPDSIARLLRDSGLTVEATGSLHMPYYKPGEYAERLFSHDIKGFVWRAHQEIGGFYGRAIGSGPMLYAVASRP